MPHYPQDDITYGKTDFLVEEIKRLEAHIECLEKEIDDLEKEKLDSENRCYYCERGGGRLYR